MMFRRLHILWICILACFCSGVSAKEVRDTLYSESGDRIILQYNLTTTGDQMTVKFINVQKKLGDRNQKKYKKLEEVSVVFFDRNGNYSDIKFDGLETSAFMIPANVTYSKSRDGYFLVNDCPTLQMTVAKNEEAKLKIPIYLANYEGKRHYKIFAQCGTLGLSSKQTAKKTGGTSGGRAVASRGGGGGGAGEIRAANADNLQFGEQVITSEELVDEGLSPADEAMIRINSVRSMLEEATEYPFDEELTHEVSMLRELRFKVTDEDVGKQITEALSYYDQKKKELAGEAKSSQAAAAAQQAEAAQAAQAKSDSIASVQALQSQEEKKNMMLIGGGIGGLVLLFLGGKQILQMINQHKLQKQQQAMMDNVMNMSKNPAGGLGDMGGLGGMTAGMGGLGGMASGLPNTITSATNAVKNAGNTVQDIKQKTSHLSSEAEIARQKLMNLRKAKQGQTDAPDQPATAPQPGSAPHSSGAPKTSPGITVKPQHNSLNDAIPAKYKRLAPKRKDTPNT